MAMTIKSTEWKIPFIVAPNLLLEAEYFFCIDF